MASDKISVSRILAGIALAFHVVWFAFLLMGAWRGFGTFVTPQVTSAAADRLDIVATALAILGVVVGIAAIGGFVIVRREAIEAAERVAREQIPLLVTRYLEIDHPERIREALEMAITLNPDSIRQKLGVDFDSNTASAYSEALTEDPET